jgi:hypothetical protein
MLESLILFRWIGVFLCFRSGAAHQGPRSVAFAFDVLIIASAVMISSMLFLLLVLLLRSYGFGCFYAS